MDFINHKPLTTPMTPILLSSPHSGVLFPDGIRVKSQFQAFPQDTDWKVDELYSFVEELGIEKIYSDYSRYVVDLNRSPENQQLYSDQRLQTSVVPLLSFSKESLYSLSEEPTKAEIERRVRLYFSPYHQKLREELTRRKQKYKQVLLFDAHSIKRQVSSIQPDPFPDMILGTRDGTSCHPQLIKVAEEALKNSPFNVAFNRPFKGGHITRSLGHPESGLNAIQLEISQDIYLAKTDITSLDEVAIDPEKQENFMATIKPMFEHFLTVLEELNQ